MDRQIVYAGQIPLETDILSTELNAMLGFHGIGSALFGTTTTVNGLACTPTTPSSLKVQVAAGEIYSVANLDDTAYSSLGSDLQHQIVKQGILLDPVQLACAAPTTAGYSVCYLIEAKFAEIDDDQTVLPYYNSSNPSQAFTGPSNSGASQPTVRRGTVTVTAKPGIAAATGSQVAPTADAGFVGLWVVTVPYGAASVSSGYITAAAGASIVPAGGILAALKAISTSVSSTLSSLASAVQNNSYIYATAGGTANALTAAINPTPSALVAGMDVLVKTAAANTGAATFNLNGLGAAPITFAGSPLPAGMLKSGLIYGLVYDGTNWELQTPSLHGVVASSLGSNGYKLYSDGSLEQWGQGAHSDNTGGQAITFPIPFANALFQTIATNQAGGPPTAFHGTGNGSKTGVTIYSSSSTGSAALSGTAFRWWAIGN